MLHKMEASGGGMEKVPSQPTIKFKKCHELPSRSEAKRKRILAYFEGRRTLLLHLYADALSSPVLHITFGGRAEVLWQLPLPQYRTTPGYRRHIFIFSLAIFNKILCVSMTNVFTPLYTLHGPILLFTLVKSVLQQCPCRSSSCNTGTVAESS